MDEQDGGGRGEGEPKPEKETEWKMSAPTGVKERKTVSTKIEPERHRGLSRQKRKGPKLKQL